MNWYYECHSVRCPYYVDHSYPRKGSNPKITCYPAAGTDAFLQLRFKTMDKRSAYMRSRCFTNYQKCEIYQMLEEKGINEDVFNQRPEKGKPEA